MTALLVFLFFAFFALTLIAAAVGFRVVEAKQKQKVDKILKTVAPESTQPKVRVFIKEEPVENRRDGLHRFAFIRSLQDRISAAGLTWSPAGLLGFMAVLAVAGVLFGQRFHVLIYPDLSSVALALLFPLLPILFVNRKVKKRMAEFEKQFPEALDFIARSVRAGHAFSVSLELLASESSEPLRTEFRKVFHELNLGSEFDKALKNLERRIPLVDVRFFVSAVLLQRETGGNLAEILMNLAHIIRERFRIKGQVKSAAAHGKITATILSLMPFILAFGLSIVAPDYLPSMTGDPMGKKMIVAALVAQMLGFYFLRKIVNIKV
ncbi:MAG TPA: type II secretion system F family protein [Bryobacteraceae bacterium]|nr:type II secretion system F family protein [Bryobacteraceae bacterium]